MKIDWISVEDKLPKICTWSPNTECGASADVLTIVLENVDPQMIVQHLIRGGRGNCTEEYWNEDYPETTHWATLPEFP